MSEGNSYRQILRSSSIIGGAAVINVVVGMLRIKAVAVLLGPSGVGLIGLYGSIMSTAATVAGLGFGNAGTRQIAVAAGHGDDAAVAAARRALFWGTAALAVVGGGIVWLLRSVVAEAVLGDASKAGEVGWLALGVSLSVASASQGALLNGLRRIGDLARISIIGGVLSSAVGVAVIALWGIKGVIAFVVSGTLVGFLLGHYFVSKLTRVQGPPTQFHVLKSQWGMLAKLGAAFMVSGLLVTLGQLFTRILIQRELGPDALGHFQAAWAISMTYVGFVLAAMGTDYYPRLTASIHDHAAVNRMVNEQIEVALIVAGPIFLAMISLAPWVIQLLYTAAFSEAEVVLRWQILGDILKIASFPLAYIILAAGDSRAFMITESIAIGIFVAVVWSGLSAWGLISTGIAFFVMYAVQLPLVFLLAKRRTGFSWRRPVLLNLVVLTAAAASITLISDRSSIAAAVFGTMMAVGAGLFGLWRLRRMVNLSGPLARLAEAGRRLAGRRER